MRNRINETFFNRQEEYAPRFAQNVDGGIDPRASCRGFYAAMNPNLRDWKPLLIRRNIHHGLLLPILAYCVDKRGVSFLGKPRPNPKTAQFSENEAYLDILFVVPAIKEMYVPLRAASFA